MFLLGNVAAGVSIIGFIEYEKHLKHAWLRVASFSLVIDWGLSNIAHGIFHLNTRMVRIIVFVLDKILPSQSIFKQNISQFLIWTILITIAAILLGLSAYFGKMARQL